MAFKQLGNAAVASRFVDAVRRMDTAECTSVEFESTITFSIEGVEEAALLGVSGLIKTKGDCYEATSKSMSGEPLCLIRDGNASVNTIGWWRKILDVHPEGMLEILKAPASITEMIFGGDCDKKNPPKDAFTYALFCMVVTEEERLILDLHTWQGELEDVLLPVVSTELDILSGKAGIADTDCLGAIEWENEYVDPTGCRAPPWRKSQGDLGYIRANTLEGTNLTILITANSLHTIEGMAADAVMDYTKTSKAYPTLVTLLQDKSPLFKERFDATTHTAKGITEPIGDGDSLSVTQTEDLSKPGGVREKKLSARLSKTAWRTAPLFSNYGFDVQLPEIPSAMIHKTLRFDETTKMDETSTIDVLDDDETAADDDDEVDEFRYASAADYPPEHWEIHKRIKYLGSGNQTATIISLVSLRDYDLTTPACQFAIREKGLDLLINLLETDDSNCKIGSLMVLKDVSLSVSIKRKIAELDGMKSMVACLDEGNEDELRSLAAETIANCAIYSRNRQKVRQYGGVEKLVKLLHSPFSESGENDMARCGALALMSCSKSQRIRDMILEADALPLLATLVQSDNVPLLIPVVGILLECAAQENFRRLIREAGMIPYFVKCLSVAGNSELQAYGALAIFKCAEDPETTTIVKNCEGLEPLVNLLASPDDTLLMKGVTGAIWKCARNPECKLILIKAKACEFLVPLLQKQPEDVLVHVVGALSELAAGGGQTKALEEQAAIARKAIRSTGGIDGLTKLLTGTNQELLINVTKAVGACARDKDNMAAISKLDGVRLLWSLLKSPNAEVQSGAAWAICPCIAMAPDAGEMVRSFVGGLELIVGLLRSEHVEVLASVCAAIANIARDNENLAVITDHGVVDMLSRLVHTADDRLRSHLADAICQCCSWGHNRVAFGEAFAVAPLVKYLSSEDPLVHEATAKALSQLSRDADNCITMHEASVVKHLIPMVGSSVVPLQEASAQCIFNIRRLALVNELAKNT
eukprot:m.102037 g.102037  ORF g.102037 m.102037 type:complete len:987 (-) comp27376_c1_seq1:97-3057(-)